jgi:uncharacterized membrane protein
MPLLSWLSFVPLAYACRSRWIFGLASLAFIFSLEYNLNPLPLETVSDATSWVASFALGLPPALLWSYDDLLLPNINYRLFKPVARNLALTCFAVVFYLLSFRWQWQPFDYVNHFQRSSTELFQSLPIIDIGILSGLAVVQWLFLMRDRNSSPRREVYFTISMIITFISFIAIVPFWHQAISRVTELAVFIFNILLGMLAWGLAQEGIKSNNRRIFWCGMLLSTLQIMSRVLEYDTGLLFKSLVFILCGSGLLAGGMWFERRTSSKPNSSGNNPTSSNKPNSNNPNSNNPTSGNKPNSNNPTSGNKPDERERENRDRNERERENRDRNERQRDDRDRDNRDRDYRDRND